MAGRRGKTDGNTHTNTHTTATFPFIHLHNRISKSTSLTYKCLKGWFIFRPTHTSWNPFLSFCRILLCDSTHISRYFDLFLWLRHLRGGLLQFLNLQNVKAVLLKIHFWYADLNNPVQEGQYMISTTLLVNFDFFFFFLPKSLHKIFVFPTVMVLFIYRVYFTVFFQEMRIWFLSLNL